MVTSPLLKVNNLTVKFGSLAAVDDVSLEIAPGEIAGLIGPNGAGKTTLFNVLTGLYSADGGALQFDGHDLFNRPPHVVVERGIARTFQNIRLFGAMSTLENVMVGLHTGKRDLIDEAYVMNSFFWMDFAPGGTNWPHHHAAAEEIYLVMDGQGEIVAGSGENGVEGRYAATAGDAYYFRPNCTVGFYNQDKPDAKAYILAVRTRVPVHEDDE